MWQPFLFLKIIAWYFLSQRSVGRFYLLPVFIIQIIAIYAQIIKGFKIIVLWEIRECDLAVFNVFIFDICLCSCMETGSPKTPIYKKKRHPVITTRSLPVLFPIMRILRFIRHHPKTSFYILWSRFTGYVSQIAQHCLISFVAITATRYALRISLWLAVVKCTA